MRAGYGRQNITPPLGVELAGYGYYLERRALRMCDPLYARAAAFSDRGTAALIISCDLLGLRRDVCDRVQEHAKKLGFSPERTILLSTHTHTGPAIKQHEGCGVPDEAYVSTLSGLIIHAVDEAVRDMTDVLHLEEVFQPFDSDLIYNRAAADGPVDRAVRGFIIARKEKPSIAMVSAACHGVFRGRIAEISADFPGEINARLEQAGYRSVYLNGLCGDIDPRHKTDEALHTFARQVFDAFLSPRKELSPTLDSGCLPFDLHLTPVTQEDISAAAGRAVQAAGGADKPAARVALAWKREMLTRFESLQSTEMIACRYLFLGGVPIVVLPFEGFTRIGEKIRNCLSRPDSLVLGCGEEILGYLPTRDDISRGAYAALESTFLYKRLPVVPGEAERLGHEMGTALERILHENDRSVGHPQT